MGNYYYNLCVGFTVVGGGVIANHVHANVNRKETFVHESTIFMWFKKQGN